MRYEIVEAERWTNYPVKCYAEANQTRGSSAVVIETLSFKGTLISCLHVHSATASVQELRPSALHSELAFRALRVLDSSPLAGSGFHLQKLLLLAARQCRDLGAAHLRARWVCVPNDRANRRNTMQSQTITFIATVSNSATSRTSKTGRKYTAFGVCIKPQPNQPAFHYNVLAWGKQGHFAKSLQRGTRIKLVIQAQSQPHSIVNCQLLTATFVRPVHPVA